MWLGKVTCLAKQQSSEPRRDSEASSRQRAVQRRRPRTSTPLPHAIIDPVHAAAIEAGAARWAALSSRIRAREAARSSDHAASLGRALR